MTQELSSFSPTSTLITPLYILLHFHLCTKENALQGVGEQLVHLGNLG